MKIKINTQSGYVWYDKISEDIEDVIASIIETHNDILSIDEIEQKDGFVTISNLWLKE